MGAARTLPAESVLGFFLAAGGSTKVYRGGSGGVTGWCADGRRQAQAEHRSSPSALSIVQRVQLHASAGAADVTRPTSSRAGWPAIGSKPEDDAAASRTSSGASRRARCEEIATRHTGHSFFTLRALRMHCEQKVWPQGVATGPMS